MCWEWVPSYPSVSKICMFVSNEAWLPSAGEGGVFLIGSPHLKNILKLEGTDNESLCQMRKPQEEKPQSDDAFFIFSTLCVLVLRQRLICKKFKKGRHCSVLHPSQLASNTRLRCLCDTNLAENNGAGDAEVHIVAECCHRSVYGTVPEQSRCH